jgi:hypothetical protein
VAGIERVGAKIFFYVLHKKVVTLKNYENFCYLVASAVHHFSWIVSAAIEE